MQINSSGNYQHVQIQQKFGMAPSQTLLRMFKNLDYQYLRDTSPSDIKDVYCLEHYTRAEVEEAQTHTVNSKKQEQSEGLSNLQIGAGRGDSYRGEGSEASYAFSHSDGVSLKDIENSSYQPPNYLQNPPSPPAVQSQWPNYPSQSSNHLPPLSYTPAPEIPQGSMMMPPPLRRRASSILTNTDRSMVEQVNSTPTGPGETWASYRDKLNSVRHYGKKLFTENALTRYFDKRNALQQAETNNPANADPAQPSSGRNIKGQFAKGHNLHPDKRREGVERRASGKPKTSQLANYNTPESKVKEHKRTNRKQGKRGHSWRTSIGTQILGTKKGGPGWSTPVYEND
jgi:hypothetical protein